jgi:hypothetical protein
MGQWIRFGSLKLYIPPIILSSMAIFIMITATRWGIGLDPDSEAYFGMIQAPLAPWGYPPGYSLMLMPLSMLGIEPASSAKYFNIVLFVLNALLQYSIIYCFTHSTWSSTLGAYLVITSTVVLEVHAMAISDAAFAFWTLLGLVMLSVYLEKGGAALLLASSLASGYAVLTRFAGAPLIPVCLLGILLFGPRELRMRFFACLKFAAVSSIPIFLWMGGNTLVYGSSGTERTMAFLGNPDKERFVEGVQSLASLLLPSMVPIGIGIFFLGLVFLSMVMLIIVYIRNLPSREAVDSERRDLYVLPILLALYIIFYLIFLILSVFIEANLPLYRRYMVPIYVSMVPMIILLVHSTLMTRKKIKLFYIAISVGIIISIFHSGRTAKWLIESFRNGSGYSSKSWHESQLIAYINNVEPMVHIYSNGDDAIRLLTNRHASPIPEKFNRRSGLTNELYSSQIEAVKEDLAHGRGVLVYFCKIDWRFYLPTRQELEESLAVGVVLSAEDGFVYASSQVDKPSFRY